MNGYEYPYSSSISEDRRRFRRRLRLILLVLMISAVTAGGIDYLIPVKNSRYLNAPVLVNRMKQRILAGNQMDQKI